jgi:hypothetical protein
MNNEAKPAGCATVWFAVTVVWLYLWAFVEDDVRHGTENLFIFFAVPLLFLAATVSVWAVRFFWMDYPQLAPRPSQSASSGRPVLVGVLLAIGAAVIWSNSFLFDSVYHSCKIILLILLSGLLLGLVHKSGGRLSVMLSLLAMALSAITTTLLFLFIVWPRDGISSWWNFVSAFIPYVASVMLFACYRKASAEVDDIPDRLD